MRQALYSIGHKIGFDKSIAYSSGARVLQGVTGVLSVFFISTFLTDVEQGFYYTFGSILALQVFFELGLTGIMTQYVAHEVSNLQLDETYTYYGEFRYKSRLASLLRFCIKWYAVISILVIFFLLVFGYFYFARYGDSQSSSVDWRWPWYLVCIATGLKLFQSPFNSILMGLGFVKETSKISFYQQLIIPIVTWLGLVAGFNLYVTGIGYIISVIIWFYFVYKDKLHKILVNLLKVKVEDKVNYIKEIFPYQWRIALSWVSGYFIFQFFNPVLFATEGAVVAGQMGMTLAALNAIQAFSMSWLNTKVPLYSNLIAQKQYLKLDVLFNKTIKQMSLVCIGLLAIFYLFLVFLKVTDLGFNGNSLFDRFLGFVPTLLLSIPIILNQFVNSWATYLRCHKKEPFLLISVISGILCMLSTLFLGNLYGLYGVVIGYCSIQLILFPWSHNIYVTKKKKWHGK